MGFRPVNHEIAGRLMRRLDLRTDAAVSGLQGALGQTRPVFADLAVETGGAAGIDRIVDGVDPLDIRSEGPLPGKLRNRTFSPTR